MATYETFDDFQADLDRSSNLSDDPFGVDVIETLDEEDIAMLTPVRRPKAAAVTTIQAAATPPMKPSKKGSKKAPPFTKKTDAPKPATKKGAKPAVPKTNTK